MRISDWSSDVCSSDLSAPTHSRGCSKTSARPKPPRRPSAKRKRRRRKQKQKPRQRRGQRPRRKRLTPRASGCRSRPGRSEEHTSELQSLMRISYAVFCLKKKKTDKTGERKSTQTHKMIHGN